MELETYQRAESIMTELMEIESGRGCISYYQSFIEQLEKDPDEFQIIHIGPYGAFDFPTKTLNYLIRNHIHSLQERQEHLEAELASL